MKSGRFAFYKEFGRPDEVASITDAFSLTAKEIVVGRYKYDDGGHWLTGSPPRTTLGEKEVARFKE